MKLSLGTYQSIIENIILLALFTGGAVLFIYFKTAGMESIFDDLLKRPFDTKEAHTKATIGGFLLGLAIIVFESHVFPKMTRLLRLAEKRAVWLLSILAIISVTVLLTHAAYEYVSYDIAWRTALERGKNFLGTGLFISFLCYYFILSLVVSFLRQLRRNFGEAVFFNYLAGNYSRPEIEKRTFMFLDLNSSTHIAEALGHKKYSRFLNRFFDDILDALKDYRYDVYQFVGDEVVFTWKVDGKDDGQAVRMFKDIKAHLLKLKFYYLEKFGVFPTFKCAVSTGKVTGTLVGRKRRNIAYHGDVLNTTARLLGQCHKYGKEILFTDFYLKSLRKPMCFTPEYLSTIKLRGKENKSKIFANV